MKLIVLGSGGWIPTERRETCTYLLDTGKSIILIDTGTGISNLFAYETIVNKYDTIHIIYTHYHHDHLCGLAYLPCWTKGKNLFFYGAGEKFYGKNCIDILQDYTNQPYFVRPLMQYAENITVTNFSEKSITIDNLQLQFIEVQHSSPCFAVLVEGFFLFATDTVVLENIFSTAASVKYLLHECWNLEDTRIHGHSSAHELKEMLQKYPQINLKLIHANPSNSMDKEAEIENFFQPDFVVKFLNDGDVLEF